MATDLDALIKLEKDKKEALEKDVSKGAAAKTKLVETEALLADLDGLAARRKTLLEVAKRLPAAEAKADKVKRDLAAVETPAPDLDKIVADPLPTPPDPAKTTYSAYTAALATAEGAEGKAAAKVIESRDAVSKARQGIDRAEIALKAAVDHAAGAADEAATAFAEAESARVSDLALAYWAGLRAKSFVAMVQDPATKNAVADAEKALGDALDAYADATATRRTAEDDAGKASAARALVEEQLAAAAGQVRELLTAKVKSR